MSSEADENLEEHARRWRLAEHLNAKIKECLTQLRFEAKISMFRLMDVVHRWERDITRLQREQKNGVHPIKHIAYQAFWIRKLKPVSDAYRTADLDAAAEAGEQISPTREVVDINERLAILVAILYLQRFAERGLYPSPDANAEGATRVDPQLLQAYLTQYMRFPEGPDRKGTTYENLIYNQRYRTFGPHHLTHIFDQVVFGALRLQAEQQKTNQA